MIRCAYSQGIQQWSWIVTLTEF